MDRRTFLQLVGAAVASGCSVSLPATPTASATAGRSAAPIPSGIVGRLAVYSALDEPTLTELLAAFGRTDPGVRVTPLPLAAASELATRIRVERASPKGDVLIGGASGFHDALGREGLLEPYVSTNASDIPAASKDASGMWTGWYTDLFGFATHTDRLARELGGRRPGSWDDLLDPAWQGKLILPDPMRTDVGYVFVVTQVFRFGRREADAMDYLKRLHPSIARYVPVSEDVLALVGQGQAVGCPSWTHDVLLQRGKGDPIDLSVPNGTSVELGAISILKGAKDVASARALIDRMLTREAGEDLVRVSGRSSTRSDVAGAQGAPSLAQTTVVDSDWPWAAENRDRLLALWQRTLGLQT